MENLITRGNFLCINLDESHSLKYVTEFSRSSLILSLAIGIMEIFARFKGPELQACLKLVIAGLKKKSDEALVLYPQFADYIKFYLEFVENLKSFEKSSQAFKYIEINTITNPSHYLNIIEIGFRSIVAGMFTQKKDYEAMIMNNTSLETIRMLIFNNVVQGFGIQLDLHDNIDKESYKNEKIGEFPIINIYIWNSNYYLAYTEELFQERWDDNLTPQVKKGPFFVVSTKKNFQPINSAPSINNISVQPVINYSDTTHLLKEIIIKTAGELLKHNQYSPEYSKFIEECFKNNQEIANIQILRKFINTVNNSAVKAAPVSSEMDILATINTNLTYSSNFVHKTCSVCGNNQSINNYPNTSHNICGVCTTCAASYNYCPRCRNQYTHTDRQILRLP